MKTAYTIPDTPHANVKPGQTGVKMVPINRMVPRSFVTNLPSGAEGGGGDERRSARHRLRRRLRRGGVDCSIDGGRSWHPAQLGADEGPYGFRRWDAQHHAAVARRLQRDDPLHQHQRCAQPDTPNWNPAGFMRNVVESVDLVAV